MSLTALSGTAPRFLFTCFAAMVFGAAREAPAQVDSSGALEPRGRACQDHAYRALDFWVGVWQVRAPDGRFLGTDSVSKILRDCVIYERWHGASGGRGESWNTFDRRARRWRATWVNDFILVTSCFRQPHRTLALDPLPIARFHARRVRAFHGSRKDLEESLRWPVSPPMTARLLDVAVISTGAFPKPFGSAELGH